MELQDRLADETLTDYVLRILAKYPVLRPADGRYEFVTCSRCGRQYQRIDYRSATHQLTCGYPLPVERKGQAGNSLTPVVAIITMLCTCAVLLAQSGMVQALAVRLAQVQVR